LNLRIGNDQNGREAAAPGFAVSRSRAEDGGTELGMGAEIERKLTNILSADVFGYSRLMGLDEAGTLAVLNTYKGVMTAAIAEHRGRLVSTAGDGVLAEFPSSVMAVQTAVAIQRELAERNQKLAPDRQMWFRIGINLGDVIVERDDIFGDDVNIAARLQALAEPGGILISGTVFDQVKNKLSLSFNFLGPQRLKNIDAEVPVYSAVMLDANRPPIAVAAAHSPPPVVAPQRKPQPLLPSAIRAGALIAFLGAINLFSWSGHLWFQWPSLGVLLIFVIRATGVNRQQSGKETTKRR
jgi:adenylate cyclase